MLSFFFTPSSLSSLLAQEACSKKVGRGRKALAPLEKKKVLLAGFDSGSWRSSKEEEAEEVWKENGKLWPFSVASHEQPCKNCAESAHENPRR